ncbi:MAG: dihydrolipoyl dehydrogenase [Deinococcales bacterium]
MRNVDVAIIGAGTAGLTALGIVRKATDDFVIVNDGPYGTTCSRVGCMPSKALIHIANDFHRRGSFAAVGIRGGDGLSVDLPQALAWVRAYRDRLTAHNLKATNQVGERNLPGRARFLAPDELCVTRADGGEERIRARATIIATGSRPSVPAAWRAFGDRILTTDTLFEQPDLPRRLAVLGLGAVGLELGQALARLGLDVTGFELRDSVAALTDPEVSAYATAQVAAELPVHLGHGVELQPQGGGLRVTAGGDAVQVDAVLASLGRRPNVDDLGLETLGVELGEQGLPRCNPHTTQLADLPVFLAGDASGDRVVMHEASDEGFIAAWNALHGIARFRRRVPLTIAFTDPEIALVGRTFAELQGEDVVTGKVDFSRQSRAIGMRRNAGRLHLYARRGDGRVLGAEMMAPDGEHLAHLLALAIDRELSLADLLAMPVYHPVLEEGLRSAVRSLARQVYGEAPLEFRRLDAGPA